MNSKKQTDRYGQTISGQNQIPIKKVRLLKRFIGIFLTAVFLLLLTACTGGTEPSSDADSRAATAQNAPANASSSGIAESTSYSEASVVSNPISSRPSASSSNSAPVSSAPGADIPLGGVLICSIPAHPIPMSHFFVSKEEFLNYLNQADSDAKKHDAVAAEKICLIPQIVSSPKAGRAK